MRSGDKVGGDPIVGEVVRGINTPADGLDYQTGDCVTLSVRGWGFIEERVGEEPGTVRIVTIDGAPHAVRNGWDLDDDVVGTVPLSAGGEERTPLPGESVPVNVPICSHSPGTNLVKLLVGERDDPGTVRLEERGDETVAVLNGVG